MDSILNYTPDANEDFYSLLGCNELSNIEQIQTEYKTRALREHPDKNMHDDQAVERFKRLQYAKEILTDPVKRADYDKWRNSGMAMSYEQWCGLNDAARKTMHWATKPKGAPMIEDSGKPKMEESVGASQYKAFGNSQGYVVGNIFWRRQQGNDLLRKFRNYEI